MSDKATMLVVQVSDVTMAFVLPQPATVPSPDTVHTPSSEESDLICGVPRSSKVMHMMSPTFGFQDVSSEQLLV